MLLAHATKLRGQDAQAVSLLTQSVRLCREIGERRLIGTCADVAALLLAGEQPLSAATLVGASDALRVSGFARNAYERHVHSRVIKALAARLAADDLESARDRGRSWTLEQTVDELLVLEEDVTGRALASSNESMAHAQMELSDREREILKMMSQGMSNREIAAELVISERTARTHVSNVLAKLGLASRTQAALWAVREGLVDDLRPDSRLA